MPLRQSIINDRIDDLCQDSGDEAELVFTKFAYSVLTQCDYDDLPPEDVVDGGQDKQIDVMSIDEDLQSDRTHSREEDPTGCWRLLVQIF